MKWPMEDWPIQSAAELATSARESINKLQRKAFSAVLTRGLAKKKQDSVLRRNFK